MRSRSAHHSRCGQRMSPSSSTVGSSPSPSSLCRCSARCSAVIVGKPPSNLNLSQPSWEAGGPSSPSIQRPSTLSSALVQDQTISF